jgi:hypothetical protein
MAPTRLDRTLQIAAGLPAQVEWCLVRSPSTETAMYRNSGVGIIGVIVIVLVILFLVGVIKL